MDSTLLLPSKSNSRDKRKRERRKKEKREKKGEKKKKKGKKREKKEKKEKKERERIRILIGAQAEGAGFCLRICAVLKFEKRFGHYALNPVQYNCIKSHAFELT